MEKSRFALPLTLAVACAAATPACVGAYVVPEKTMQTSDERAEHEEIFRKVKAAMDCAETCDAMAQAVENVLEKNGGEFASRQIDTPSVKSQLNPTIVAIQRLFEKYRFPHHVEASFGFTQGLSGREFRPYRSNDAEATEREMIEALEPTAKFEFTLERIRRGGGIALMLPNGGETYVERTCVARKPENLHIE